MLTRLPPPRTDIRGKKSWCTTDCIYIGSWSYSRGTEVQRHAHVVYEQLALVG